MERIFGISFLFAILKGLGRRKANFLVFICQEHMIPKEGVRLLLALLSPTDLR